MHALNFQHEKKASDFIFRILNSQLKSDAFFSKPANADVNKKINKSDTFIEVKSDTFIEVRK
jgi:hypothetical protein